MKVQLTQQDGVTPPAKKAKVSVICSAIPSIISDISCYVNGTQVTNRRGFYPYRVHLSQMIGLGLGPKTSQLSSELFFLDDAGFYMPPLAIHASNMESWVRQRAFKNELTGEFRSDAVQFLTNFYHPLCNLEAPLLTKYSVRFEINQTRQAFRIFQSINAAEHRLELKEAYLLVPFAVLNDGPFEQLSSRLKQKPSKVRLLH